MGERTRLDLISRGWTLALPALLLAGCATARTARAPEPEPLGPPAGEALVVLRDLTPGQPLVAFGRWSDHLPPAASLRLRDGVVEAARGRGLPRVRAATTQEVLATARPVPRPAAADEGAVWGDNVPTPSGQRSRTEPARLRPPAGVTWLEVTGLTVEMARLAEAPGAGVLTLQVTAERTDPPAGGAWEPRTTEVRFTILDEASGPAMLGFPDVWTEAQGPAVDEAVARLLDRATARLASALVPPAAEAGGTQAAVEAAPAPGSPAAHGPAVPLEVTYQAKRLGYSRAKTEAGEKALHGAGSTAEVMAYGGLLCGPLAPLCAGVLGLAGFTLGAAAGVVSVAAAPSDGPIDAPLPPETEKAALLQAVRRRAEALALAAAVERTARRELELSPTAGGAAPPRVSHVEVRLTGDQGTTYPARLALVVTTAAPTGPGDAALVQETPDALPVQTWADDDGALVGVVLERAAVLAGRALAEQVRQAAKSPAPGGGDSMAVRP